MRKTIFGIILAIIGVVVGVSWIDYRDRQQITFTEQLVSVIEEKDINKKKETLIKINPLNNHQKLLINLWKHNLKMKTDEYTYKDCLTDYNEYSLAGECLKTIDNDLGNDRYLPKYLTLLRKKDVNIYQMMTYFNHQDRLFNEIFTSRIIENIKK